MDLYDMLGEVGGGFRRADKSRTRLTLNNMKDNPFGGLMAEIEQRQQPMVGLGPVTADFAIDRMRDAKTQLEQARAAARVNAARERLAMDRAKSRAMTGTYQNPELTRLGNAEQIAAAMERARGGAAPGQQVDPRWLLGGISVSGQGLTRGGGGAAPAPASMGREALAARLAQMAQSGKYGGQYTRFPTVETEQDGVPRSYRIVAGKPEMVDRMTPTSFITESSNGRGMALVGRLPQERLDAIAAQRAEALGKAGDKTLLELAREKRKEKNVTRMLSSRNPAVRARGMELADAIRKREGGLVQDEGVDIETARREGQKVFNATGDSALARQTMMDDINRQRAAAEAKRRRAEEKEDKEAERKFLIERDAAKNTLARWEQEVLMDKQYPELTDPVARERKRRELFGDGAGVGTVLAPRPPVDMSNPLPRATGPVVPRPFASAGAPPLPSTPAAPMPMPRGNGVIGDPMLFERGFWPRVGNWFGGALLKNADPSGVGLGPDMFMR